MTAARPHFVAELVLVVAVALVAAQLHEPWRAAVTGVAIAGAIWFAIRWLPPGEAVRNVSNVMAAPAPVPVVGHRLVDVLEVLPVGIVIVGADGKIATFNAAAGEIFAVPTERAVGRALIEVVRNFDLDRRLSATLSDGTEETAELSYSAAQERRLQVTTRLLAGAAGERNALAIIVDLSRMRELETLRREFVSNVSHELRTPLTAVKLMVETLQIGVDPKTAEEFLRSIEGETERMIALVEDLLDLARLESGKLELRLAAVDVTELCRQAVLAQRGRAEVLGIHLLFSAPDMPIMITADRDKLYQVVVNLVDNALRHTPAGGSVTLSVEKNGGLVSVVVSDTGDGIPSTALPHIFERFYVVDPARARNRSGTGIGLAIVKHIVEAHGGTILAESELGKGTTFRCTLRG